MEKQCVKYQGLICSRPACTDRHNINCCWDCVEYPDCDIRCKKDVDRKPTTTGRRELKIGDVINVQVEVIALVNHGFEASAVLKTGRDYIMMDADALISFKYGEES